MSKDFRSDNYFNSMVTSLEMKRDQMNQKFQNGEYGESINFARSLIEATLKYVYHEITHKELEQDKGRENNNGYYIGLKKMAEVTLNKLSSLINHKELIKKISDNLSEVIANIGTMRNESAISHGSRIRNIEPQKEETLFVISISEDICIFLLKLLYARTQVEEKNVIGGRFDKQCLPDFKSISSYSNNSHYKVKNSFAMYDYYLAGDLISSIEITSAELNENIDNELIKDMIRDVLPPDVDDFKEQAPHNYKCYSSRHDRYYDIVFEQREDSWTYYISGIETW